MVRVKQILAAVLLCLLSVFAITPVVQAAQANSSNYGVSEVNFGSGGELHACSTTYCAKQSAGELVVGNTASTNYKAQGGFNTNRDPILEVSVNGGPIDLGLLNEASVKSGSTTFSVRSYPAYGYNVLIDGSTPTNNSDGHVLAPMSTAGVSVPGSEQFGINLRANTSPSVGADVVQIPDSTFGFGTPAAGYNTVNNFKYVAGDTIATSPKSSGQTNFTLSIIANITTNTVAGTYKGRLSVIVVPTF
jgi:hypothetical protein